jgi:hypothetical protein
MKRELHVAAVYSHDGIRLLTASHSSDAVAESLAAYIESQADILLRLADAQHVRGLLETGETEEAITAYFARVGERWEREHLRREAVVCSSSTPGTSAAGPASRTPVMEADESSVRALYQQLIDGWNRGDATAFAVPFSEDADFIAFDGTHFRGRPEIESSHRLLFAKCRRAGMPR